MKQSHLSTLCTLSLRMYSAVLRVSLGTLQRRYITTITSSVTTEFLVELLTKAHVVYTITEKPH